MVDVQVVLGPDGLGRFSSGASIRDSLGVKEEKRVRSKTCREDVGLGLGNLVRFGPKVQVCLNKPLDGGVELQSVLRPVFIGSVGDCERP